MKDVHIGTLIKSKMEEKGLTIEQLARKIHCDRTNIYHIFKRKSMDVEQLKQIGDALNFDFFQYYKEDSASNNDIRLNIVLTLKNKEWTVEEIREI